MFLWKLGTSVRFIVTISYYIIHIIHILLIHIPLVAVNVKNAKGLWAGNAVFCLTLPTFFILSFLFCNFIFLLHPWPKYLKNCIKRITRKWKILRFHNKADVATRCHYNKSLKDLISFCLHFFDESVFPTVCFFCVLNFPDLQSHSGLLFML